MLVDALQLLCFGFVDLVLELTSVFVFSIIPFITSCWNMMPLENYKFNCRTDL